MALAKGAVTIDATDASHASSGLVGRMFDAFFLTPSGVSAMAAIASMQGDPEKTPAENEQLRIGARIRLKTQIAELITPIAEAVVDEIVANAEVTVTIQTTDAGLQRTPDPNDENEPTQGPTAAKELRGVVT